LRRNHIEKRFDQPIKKALAQLWQLRHAFDRLQCRQATAPVALYEPTAPRLAAAAGAVSVPRTEVHRIDRLARARKPLMDKVRIDRRWLPLNALRAFEGVARHGSFTAAASALNIAQSALSRHVISLENLIGVKLFDRRPHALVLTPAGQHLLPAVSRSFDRLEHAIDEIRSAQAPRLRTLRVQMPPSFAVHLAAPLLRDFRSLNREVEIDLVSPYGVGPPPGDVDVAVVYSRPTVTDRVRDLLWPVRLGLVCHPDVAAKAAGKDLAAFIRDNELVHMRVEGLPRHHQWLQFLHQMGLGGIDIERGLVFDTEMLMVQYILSGEGIALVDLALFREHLDSGRLVRPYEVALDDGFGYYLITDPEALSDTAVALFRSWLIAQFGAGRIAAAAGDGGDPQNPGASKQ
jgi:DNA-binding transcriptional LysR family regulator